MYCSRKKTQLILVFELRKSVYYWWSYILFAPECKELTCMLDPLLYRWRVPPVVIRCVHWTMQRGGGGGVLQTWITPQSPAIVMNLHICDALHIGRTVLLLKPPQSPHCYLGAVDHAKIFPPPLVMLQAWSYRAYLCGHWGCAAHKGPFLSPISIAKGLILAGAP